MLWKKDKLLIADLERSRPVLSEIEEVLKLALMEKETNGELYIVHVSAESIVKLLKKGKISMVLRRGEICVKEDVIQENISQGTYIKC